MLERLRESIYMLITQISPFDASGLGSYSENADFKCGRTSRGNWICSSTKSSVNRMFEDVQQKLNEVVKITGGSLAGKKPLGIDGDIGQNTATRTAEVLSASRAIVPPPSFLQTLSVAVTIENVSTYASELVNYLKRVILARGAIPKSPPSTTTAPKLPGMVTPFPVAEKPKISKAGMFGIGLGLTAVVGGLVMFLRSE